MTTVRSTLEKLVGGANVEDLAVASRGSLPMAVPRTEEEILETIRLAGREHWRILPVGTGSKLSRNPSADRADLALSLRRISGVGAYEPGDGTLTARAGTTIAALDAIAREGGNHLTPRVPAPHRATLGGVLAAGQSGLDRLRYGPARHHVLGMRVALADASVARTGGRLVKNVTGYDLHRLYCGSSGSLCLILEASMRLFAGFEREILLTAAARDRSSAMIAARRVDGLGVQPLCIRAENVLDPGGNWRVHVLLAGRGAVVESGRRLVRSVLPEAREDAETIERLRDAEIAGGAWPMLRASGRPSRFLPAIDGLPAGTTMVLDPSIAIASILVDPPAIDGLARGLVAGGLAVDAAGRESSGRGEEGVAGDLSDRLKRAFDPDGILAIQPSPARS